MQSRLQNQINYDQNFKNVYIKNLICKQSIHTQLEENEPRNWQFTPDAEISEVFYSLCFYILSKCSIMSLYYFLNQGEVLFKKRGPRLAILEIYLCSYQSGSLLSVFPSVSKAQCLKEALMFLNEKKSQRHRHDLFSLRLLWI